MYTNNNNRTSKSANLVQSTFPTASCTININYYSYALKSIENLVNFINGIFENKRRGYFYKIMCIMYSVLAIAMSKQKCANSFLSHVLTQLLFATDVT